MDEAIDIERLQRKYNTKTVGQRKVNFNLDTANDTPTNTNSPIDHMVTSNQAQNNSGDNASVPSLTPSMDKAYMDLVNEMRELKINMVQYQQQHQQQPRYNQPRSQMPHFNNRPPFTERRPLVCWNCGKEGHPSRICREQPRMGNIDNNYNNKMNEDEGKGNGRHLIQVQDQDQDHGEDSDDENKTKDLDIYAVKRKQTDESSLEKLRKRKGKEKATEPQDRLQYWNSLPGPSQFTRESNIRSNPVPNPQPLPGPSNPYRNYGTHMNKFATNNNSSPQPNTQENKKPRKRKPKAKTYSSGQNWCTKIKINIVSPPYVCDFCGIYHLKDSPKYTLCY
ncbi:hypothetical protein G6F37_013031 [Rhizopus arrhizus]|nr:hypothetical protein G6F37_013031 [Rhizopus arrhizus]